jgi:maleate cis-trans isomerase
MHRAGPGGDKKIIDLIEKATGVPATTCVTSMVKGLQRMDIHPVVVVCPYYQEEPAGMLRKVLEQAGFDVVSLIRGMWNGGKSLISRSSKCTAWPRRRSSRSSMRMVY